jgi:lysophospholipase L1-like esterase
MQYSILCLGDSYTIGESVALHEGFPYQLIQQLRKAGYDFAAPEIIAKTGWTTFELLQHLSQIQLSNHYNFVTLLIGVNNQYRDLSINDFEIDFEQLLKRAIEFADHQNHKVIVLSIPDWGTSTFGKDKNENKQISNAINEFNAVCKKYADQYNTAFVDITEETRKAREDTRLLAKDGLHYSAKEHAIWATSTFEAMKKVL